MEKLLKEWRQDAINKHQYESAIFIGDKLLALTSKDRSLHCYAFVNLLRGLERCLFPGAGSLLDWELHKST